MRISRNKYFLIIIIIIFLIGCSSSDKINNEIQIEITKHDIDAWLNLMPGMSSGTFHLNGELTLKNSGNVDIDSLGLANIIVYADSEEVYTFKPAFKTKSNNEQYSLKAGASKEFTFGTEKGLKINEKLIDYKMIDLKLELQTHMGERSFVIKNIKVERTY